LRENSKSKRYKLRIKQLRVKIQGKRRLALMTSSKRKINRLPRNKIRRVKIAIA
jgi:hypothetical protein